MKGEFCLYREGMTPAVARVYEALDRERLAILDQLGLRYHHYAELDPRGHNLGETMEECHNRILSTSMDTAFGAGSIEAGLKMKGPTSMQVRYITEDVPYGLVLPSSLGRLLEIPTPISDAIVNLCGAINRADVCVPLPDDFRLAEAEQAGQALPDVTLPDQHILTVEGRLHPYLGAVQVAQEIVRLTLH